MRLYFYRGKEPNFGDELNHYMLPHYFGDILDENEDALLLGIGSILFDTHPAKPHKHVFGSGYGGYTAPPHLDDRWHIYCVRGEFTARTLGLGRETVAGDGAILLNAFRGVPSGVRRQDVSFIPHFESLRRGRWDLVCEKAGVQLIDPRDDVETVLTRISESRLVIAEAMHGAIVADALRVPWIPILPRDRAHRMKWHDWASALDLTIDFRPLPASSLKEALFQLRGRNGKRLDDLLDRRPAVLRPVDEAFTSVAARRLAEIAHRPPQMSSDGNLQKAVRRLLEARDRLVEAAHAPVPSRS